MNYALSIFLFLVYTSKVPLQSARLSEAHGAHTAPERARVNVTLVVHNQARALHERLVTAHTRLALRRLLLQLMLMLILHRTGSLLLLPIKALEMSLIYLICLIVNAELLVGVLGKDFKARVARSTGHVELWWFLD